MKRDSVSLAIVFPVCAVFVMYGVYALVQTRANPQLLGIVLALVSVTGGVGLMLNRRWSRYCIYVVSAAVIGTWFYYVALAAHSWPYDTLLESVISLLAGLFVVLVAAASSYLVRKHFGA
jgi:hypothetical protein